jgi:RES domain-containing protein
LTLVAAVTVWRIVRPEHAATAYSGEGSRLNGGRFNSAGRTLVYASESLSLAMLEQLVRVGSFRRVSELLAVPATFDDAGMEAFRPGDLPAGWDARPYTSVSQRVGDAWLESGRSLALRVPSVVVPYDSNLLINPDHPDFARLAVGEPVSIPIDPRLLNAR